MTETNIAELRTSSGITTEDVALFTTVIEEGNILRSEEQRIHLERILKAFQQQIQSSHITDLTAENVTGKIQQRVEELDRLLNSYVNAILHNTEFQQLEATWRALHRFIHNTETSKKLKIRVLNASTKELKEDLTDNEWDQSDLFKKVYEEEYGTYGGHPYGVLVSDIEFTRHPEDFDLMKNLAGLAAGAHAPLIAAADPALFDLESFSDLGDPVDLEKVFESAELSQWRAFRASEDSRYMALVLPRVLQRLPYGKDTKPVDTFEFEEVMTENGTAIPSHSRYLWGSAAFSLAERITEAVAKHAWPAAIRGAEGGGKVGDLPIHTFEEAGETVGKCPTEIAITDRRENELNKLGFIALCHRKGENYATFFGGATTQEPKSYFKADATANAELSAKLPYILAASRFAHYIKVMMRDKIGSFMTRGNVEIYLNTWIANYVLLNDDAPQSAKAHLPLREARIDVKSKPGHPGSYEATVFLKPHFQLEELTTSIRLVAELPQAAEA